MYWQLDWSRPHRAAWLIGPSRRRLRGANGPCSFKSPLVPQRRSDRYVTGWRLLTGCLHRPTALHWNRTSPGLQAPLHSDEQQPCTGLELLLDSNSTPLDWTHLDSTRLTAWRSSASFYGVWGCVWSFTFDLLPPAGSAPFGILIRSRCQTRTCADVVEIIGSRPNEGVPASVGGDAVR